MQNLSKIITYLETNWEEEYSKKEETFLIKFPKWIKTKNFMNILFSMSWIICLFLLVFFNSSSKQFLENSNVLITFTFVMIFSVFLLILNILYLFFYLKNKKIRIKINLEIKKNLNLVDFLNYYFEKKLSFEKIKASEDRNLVNLTNNIYFLNGLIRNSYDIDLKINEEAFYIHHLEKDFKFQFNLITSNFLNDKKYWTKFFNSFLNLKSKNNLTNNQSNFSMTFKNLKNEDKVFLEKNISEINQKKYKINNILHFENFENFTYINQINLDLSFNNFEYSDLVFKENIKKTIAKTLCKIIDFIELSYFVND